ncbi:MAG: DNA alkylation repair protein [Xanthomonadales bacterium]|nr:DNA alkylation repair protein [Xanthomonadales bacterium]
MNTSNIVTRKSEIKIYLQDCIDAYYDKGLSACINQLEKQILSKKVKFPLLGFCGHEFYKIIKNNEHIEFCDNIEKLKAEGGNVVIGIILQDKLSENFNQSFDKATEYISQANAWYVCDIIGERVFGYVLLTNPDKSLPIIKKLTKHPSHWVIRSLGAGIHYAIKKGLDKEHVISAFQLLLSMSNNTDKEIKQGVGWAAKTTAKFHPDIIEQFSEEVSNHQKIAAWFRTKIKIGLERNKYAQRN